MSEVVRSLFGEVHEIAVVGLSFVLILSWSVLPRLGEIVGGMFDRRAGDGR